MYTRRSINSVLVATHHLSCPIRFQGPPTLRRAHHRLIWEPNGPLPPHRHIPRNRRCSPTSTRPLRTPSPRTHKRRHGTSNIHPRAVIISTHRCRIDTHRRIIDSMPNQPRVRRRRDLRSPNSLARRPKGRITALIARSSREFVAAVYRLDSRPPDVAQDVLSHSCQAPGHPARGTWCVVITSLACCSAASEGPHEASGICPTALPLC